MDPNQAAVAFKALGDPTRVRILQFLCSKSEPVALDDEGDVRPVQGATVGEVCCHITGGDQFSSTVSFHLKELRLAGLISADKSGKFMICSVNRPALEDLSVQLTRWANTIPLGCLPQREPHEEASSL